MTSKILFTVAAFALGSVAFAADRNCQLLNAGEANAIFGIGFRAGTPSRSDDGKPDCEYNAPDGTVMLVGVVDKNGRSIYSAQKSSLADNPGRIEKVPGLGDEALLQVFSIGGGVIAVRRDDAFFVIAITGRKTIPVKDGLIQLAREALDHL